MWAENYKFYEILKYKRLAAAYPLGDFDEIFEVYRQFLLILMFKFGGFAEGIPKQLRFNLEVHFPPIFAAYVAAKLYIGCEKV